MNILLLLFYLFYVYIFLLYCYYYSVMYHVCYCDACKCLHGLGICVWFYPSKLMMMMISWRLFGNVLIHFFVCAGVCEVVRRQERAVTVSRRRMSLGADMSRECRPMLSSSQAPAGPCYHGDGCFTRFGFLRGRLFFWAFWDKP